MTDALVKNTKTRIDCQVPRLEGSACAFFAAELYCSDSNVDRMLSNAKDFLCVHIDRFVSLLS